MLLVEEVSEYLYAFDRVFFHVTSVLAGRGLAGLRLGRVSDVPENDRPFGIEAEAIARYWCERNGIPWLGRADIGHDGANKVVPFGLQRAGCRSSGEHVQHQAGDAIAAHPSFRVRAACRSTWARRSPRPRITRTRW